jgi:adenylate cyclase
MFTDMVGYTASSQSNEASALALRREQENILRPLVAAYQGRRVKSTGDGILVEFESALKATECAVSIQRRLRERNESPDVTPIMLRIGLHLGDVEQEGSDIFGDSVNLAARIEPMAEPGGICLSAAVYEQVRNKLTDKFERLERREMKGVKVAPEVYKVVLPWTGRSSTSEPQGPASIAVLPFSNISPDPTDEYFAEGLTEELITVLSQLRNLRVTSRTSVMQFKTTTKSAAQIGSELGVGSILEGSVRKAGNRLRITAQLIDAQQDRHVWAQTFDKDLDDIFAVQSAVAKEVAEALKVNLRAPDVTRLASRPKPRPDSYLAYLKGRTLMHRAGKESLLRAKAEFERAVALDQGNAAGYSGLADVYRHLWADSGGQEAVQADQEARRLAARALELDPDSAEAHSSLGFIIWDDFEFEAAERECQLALSLNPSYSEARRWYSALLADEGRADEALAELNLAEATDPLDAGTAVGLVRLHTWAGRFDEAAMKLEKLRQVWPDSYECQEAATWFYRGRGDVERTTEALERYEELQTLPAAKQIHRAWRLALLGKREAALTILDNEALFMDHSSARWLTALVHAEMGDLDRCFHWLNLAVDARHVAFQPWRLDPKLEHVRRDPRFKLVLARANLAES